MKLLDREYVEPVFEAALDPVHGQPVGAVGGNRDPHDAILLVVSVVGAL